MGRRARLFPRALFSRQFCQEKTPSARPFESGGRCKTHFALWFTTCPGCRPHKKSVFPKLIDLSLFARLLHHVWHAAHHKFISARQMGNGAGAAILEPVLRVVKRPAARLSQRIERTIAEKAVEKPVLPHGVAGEISAVPVAKIGCIRFCVFVHLDLPLTQGSLPASASFQRFF